MAYRGAFRWLLLSAAVTVAACDRSDREAELEGKVADLEAQQRATKENDLAARERALAEKEAALTANAEESPEEKGATPGPRAKEKGKTTSKPAKVSVAISVAIGLTKPNGKSWDVGGGAPDPLVSARISSSGKTVSRSFRDSLNPSTSFSAELAPSDSISITVVDSDMSANDPIGSFTASYSGSPTTRKGKNGAATFSVTFQ